MSRVALFAPLAGLMGSVFGMVLYLGFSALQPGFESDHIAAWPIVFLFTLIFTVPGCLMIGTPVVFGLKNGLRNHPVPITALITLIGMVIGYACFSWLFRPFGDEQLLLLTCAGGSAFSLAVLFILND